MKPLEQYDYEIEVEYLGMDYTVYADLYEHGNYNVIAQAWDCPGYFEILDDPQFHNYVVYDTETGLEVLPEHRGEILLISENVLRNCYWQEELNF